MKNSSRWILFALKAAVSICLIAYLLEKIGIGDAMERARMLSAATGAGVILLLMTYTSVSAVRWLVVQRALECRAELGPVAWITFVAAFFNQFLPASVGGDAVRVWASFRHGLDVSKAIDSVLLERASHLACVSLLAAVAATAWNEGRLPPPAVPALWLAFAAVLTATVMLAVLDRIPQRLLPAALARGAQRLATDARSLFSSPGQLAVVFLTALINQTLVVIAVLAIAWNLGVRIGVADCIALLPAVIMVGSLPVSVSGWGVREYAMVTAFGYAAVPAADALAVGLLLSLLSVAAALPGGLIWLVSGKRRVSR